MIKSCTNKFVDSSHANAAREMTWRPEHSHSCLFDVRPGGGGSGGHDQEGETRRVQGRPREERELELTNHSAGSRRLRVCVRVAGLSSGEIALGDHV